MIERNIVRGQTVNLLIEDASSSDHPKLGDKMKWRIAWLISLFSRRAHFTNSGKPKQSYNTKQSADKAAIAMHNKTGRDFDSYRCWVYCRKFHIGGSVKEV